MENRSAILSMRVKETDGMKTHTIAIGIADMNGIMRGKRIPASNWENVRKNGTALCLSTFAMDMTSDIWDTPFANFDNGYPDFHLYASGEPIRVPWEEGTAFCMGYAKNVPIDPRGALIDQIKRAKNMGLTVKVGTELEFYLLDPETLKPKDEGIQVYSLERAAELEHVVGPIRRFIDQMGIPIEQSNPEYAPGQVEVNIKYDEALKAADRVVMFRSFVRQLARAHGYLATFMAKPFIDESGNGFHAHYSLWKGGKNIFARGKKISDKGLAFLAGLQKRMIETAFIGATTPNCYRRYQPLSFCPINNSWGYDNRTVALRVLEGDEKSVRIEKRSACADCNPYYLLACDIAAGLDGIEKGWRPSAPCLGNGYEDKKAQKLPTDLASAIDSAQKSELVKRVLGEARRDILIQQGRREIEFNARQITQTEIDRYLKNF